MIERLRSDLTDAVRALIATPVTTFATVLLLAVAVGANLAVFGLIDRAILTPTRHVTRPDRLFTLAFEVPNDASRGAGMTTTSYVAFDTLREHAPSLAGIAAWRRTSTTVIVAGEQTRAEAMLVSGAYFAVLGAVAQLGRAIAPADDHVSSAAAVVSHAFWRSVLGGDPGVVGRRVTVNRIDYVVSGVMPAGFSGHSATRVDIWLPLAAAMRDTPGWNLDGFRNIVSIIARVEPGAEVAAVAQASAALERRVSLVGLDGGEVAPTERRIAYALAGVSFLVLVIGLANAATLLLVRGTRRRRESAIRTALGATRGRLFARILIEAALLATMATAGALALSSWLGEAVRRLLMAGVIENEGLTPRTLLLALAAGLVTLVLAAVTGVLQLPRGLRAGDLSGTGSDARRSRAYPVLLLVQTTLSVVLIAGAGMFGRSLYNLMAQDFGMRLSDVVLVGFEQGPGMVAEQDEIFNSALERVRAMPGVEAATVVKTTPFAGHHVPPIGVPGMAESPSVNGQLPFLIAATPEFLDILGIDILQGRRFTRDDERGAPVVIVNQTMARAVWPGESALGKCIRIGFDPSFDPFTAAGPPGPPRTVPCREVVGVSRDVRQRSIVPGGGEDRLMQYFVPFSQVPGPPAGVGEGPGVQGLLVRDKQRGREPHHPDSPRRARWPNRPAVCRSAPVLGTTRAADASLATGHRASVALWRPRAGRRRSRALCRVRSRDRRAPARDGDPHRRRRPARARADDDPARSGPPGGSRRAVWVRARRGRGPMAGVDARGHGAIRSSRARRGRGPDVVCRRPGDVPAGACGVACRSDGLAASRVSVLRERFALIFLQEGRRSGVHNGFGFGNPGVSCPPDLLFDVR